MRKPFDRALYDANDTLAKDHTTKVLIEAGYEPKVSPKKRDVDLEVYKDGVLQFYVECEIKRVWTKQFQYQTINMPERKGKYACLDLKTYFFMWNNDQTRFLVIKGADLLASPLVIVPNKFVSYGEKFFQIPIEKVTFDEFKE
jgi:hypothetical protein